MKSGATPAFPMPGARSLPERNTPVGHIGETHDVTVVIVTGQKMILVTRDREFDLGVVQPDERIVRELEGTEVVNATVVKASDLNQT